MRTLLPLVAVVVGGCAASTNPGFGGPSATSDLGHGIGISPLAQTPYVGTSIPLRVTGARADNEPTSVMWTTQPLARAWVTSDGVAHFFQPGRVRVIARQGDRVAATELEIRDNPVEELHASRAYGGPVFAGDSIRIDARAYDAADREVEDVRPAFAIDVRGEVRPRASITAEGMFVAEEPGLYTVLVETNGRAAIVPILVRPTPAPAEPVAPAGTSADVDSLAASRRAPRLAPVVVLPATVRRVKIRSADYTAYTGTSMRLAASVWMSDSREPDTTATVAWSSSDTSIAIVDADGFVSFRRRGWVRISARHGDVRDVRRLNVRRNPAAHVVLQSNARYPRVGQPIRLTEEAWAPGAIRIPYARAYFGIVSQTEGKPSASITDDRIFIAREPGAYTVVAVLGGRASKTTFVVYPGGRRCELGLRKWDPSCRN